MHSSSQWYGRLDPLVLADPETVLKDNAEHDAPWYIRLIVHPVYGTPRLEFNDFIKIRIRAGRYVLKAHYNACCSISKTFRSHQCEI